MSGSFNDFYKEQLIESSMDSQQRIKGILIGVAFLVVLFIFSQNIFINIGIITICGYLENRFVNIVVPAFISFDFEYEYTATNSFFEIDSIVNRAQRKQICSFDLSDVSYFGKANSQRFLGLEQKSTKKFDCSNLKNKNIEDKYACIVSKNGEATTVIFEPKEEIVKIFEMFVPKHAQN